MKSFAILSVSLLVFSFTAKGQENISIYKSVPTDPATAYSVDRTGNMYIAFETGTVAKIDGVGTEVLNYSPQRIGEVTLMDAWNPLKVFLFYEDFQSVVLLDRFLTPTSTYDLSDKGQGFIKLACPSHDNTFWLIDEAYKGLVKYDPADQQVLYRIPFAGTFPADSEALFMREYQNLLFLSLNSGDIVYFDSLGNYLGKIETTEAVNFFGFLKNQIYYIITGGVRYADLYKGEKKDVLLPVPYEVLLDAGTHKAGIKKEGGLDLLR